MPFEASTPAEDPLLRRGIIKNPSWRIKRPAGYISKYSNSSALWKSIVENKWCIGFFTFFSAGIIFSFMMRMALRFRYRENQIEIPPLHWYEEGLIYRIYIPSFADSDGNGIGDFSGIQSHLSYLQELGVKVLWLSAIQETNTYGYDVTNFTKTKDEFGHLDKFKALLNSTASMGMKVIMDIIINHSSRAHDWFQKSKRREPLYSDYYVWHNSVPNNWRSVYNGSAWAFNVERKEHYLHQFRSNEPDLNYRTLQVVSEMKKVVRFWIDQGVEGFYIRDLPFLYESKHFTSESPSGSNAGISPEDYLHYSHNMTRDLAESYQIIQDIFVSPIQESSTEKKIVLMADFSNRMISENNFQTHQLLASNTLYRLRPGFNGIELKSAVEQTLNDYRKTQICPVWILGSEETSRISSKFQRRAIGLQIVQLLMPGTKSIYYGEEIEMTNHPQISFQDTRDPVAKDLGQNNFSLVSKDPFRTPMLWNASKHSGFTTADEPWLPMTGSRTADSQMKKSTSVWNSLVALNKMRNSSVALKYGWVTFPFVSENIFVADWTHMTELIGYLLLWNLSSSPERISFSHIDHLSDELQVIRKIGPDTSHTNTQTVKKLEFVIEKEEVWILTYQRVKKH